MRRIINMEFSLVPGESYASSANDTGGETQITAPCHVGKAGAGSPSREPGPDSRLERQGHGNFGVDPTIENVDHDVS